MIYTTLNIGDIIHVCCNLREDDWEQIEKFSGASRNIDQLIMHCFATPGPKWAAKAHAEDSFPLVIGGFIPQRNGVYQTWFLVAADAWLTPDVVTAIANERLDFMMKNGAHRLETLCLGSRKKAHRWYGAIGLTFESTLKGYCADGSDAVMYVRTSNVHV